MVELPRVIVTTTIFPNREEGSKGVYISKIVEALSRVCPTVVIAPIPFCPSFVQNPQYTAYKKIPPKEKLGKIDVHHPRYLVTPKVGRSLYGLLYFVSTLRLFISVKREFRPNCLLAFWAYPDGFAAMLIGKLLNIPVVIGCRGCDVNAVGESLLRSTWVHLALTRCRKVFAVSQAMSQVIQKLGVDKNRIAVIPNGIDLQQFQPKKKEQARAELSALGLRSRDKVILYCGRLSEEKGLMFLAQAMLLMKQNHQPVRLLVVGDGPLKPGLLEFVENSGLDKEISVLSEMPHDTVTTLINASDVLCLPSLREGWPNIVVEALSCGIPVVASRVGGVPEILSSSSYGRLVAPADPEQLASALWEALNCSWDHRRIQNAFRSRTWDVVASEMLEAIQNGSAGDHSRVEGIVEHASLKVS